MLHQWKKDHCISLLFFIHTSCDLLFFGPMFHARFRAPVHGLSAHHPPSQKKANHAYLHLEKKNEHVTGIPEMWHDANFLALSDRADQRQRPQVNEGRFLPEILVSHPSKGRGLDETPDRKLTEATMVQDGVRMVLRRMRMVRSFTNSFPVPRCVRTSKPICCSMFLRNLPSLSLFVLRCTWY